MRRSPLVNEDLGTSPSQALAFDDLHCVALGILQEVILKLLWIIIDLPRWGYSGAERHTVACEAINGKLQLWYEQQRKIHPESSNSEISPFVVAVVGTKDNPLLHAMGGESYHLFKFCYEALLPEFVDQIVDGHALATCMAALAQWYKLLHRLPDVPTQSDCLQLWDLCCKHLIWCSKGGIDFKPKHHYFCHLTLRK